MRRYLTGWMALALLAAVWLTGCSGRPTIITPSDEPATSPTHTYEREVEEKVAHEETPAATAQPQREHETTCPTRTPLTEEATMTPEPTSSQEESELPPGAQRVVQLAQEDLARRLDLSPEEMLVVSIEAVEWSDTSLGCPQPGMMYAQVITPGFRLVLEAEGETYQYHTDRTAQVVRRQPDGDG